MITVVRAGLADGELIARLSRKTFYDTFAPHNTDTDMRLFMNGPFTDEKLAAETGLPENIFFLAYDDDNPVGYAKMRTGDTPVGISGSAAIEIARLYAVQEAIGRGVGKALMAECLRYAASIQSDVVWLGVWEKNDRAIAFYTSWGFERFGEHDFVLGNDVQKDWLMQKRVGR